MQQFQSLQRLLVFYTLTLVAMLSLYYFILFHEMRNYNKQHSVEVFHTLQHEMSEYNNPINPVLKDIMEKPFMQGVSYQLIFAMPSGETYIYQHTQPNEHGFAGIMFPTIETSLLSYKNSHSTYTLSERKLVGTIELKSGHKLYTVLRHKPLDIDWVSYRYWLPLMTAIMFFTLALLYVLKRHANWEQLLRYTDNLSSHAKDAYIPPPFVTKESTPDFIQLGNALSRVSYQLHNNHRRITTLQHRLERLVDHAPLPMLMIMRHGQISFFNKRFEQVFSTAFHDDSSYQLTDFIFSEDPSTQLLLQKLSTLRITRTLLVCGLTNRKAYQLHITPWFGEHGQVHGFTVLLNNINELVSKNAQLQQQNVEMQRRLDEFSILKSSMGHDLRLPLEAMIDTLEPIDISVLTDKQKQTVNTLVQTSQAMLIMLDEMLDIGEIEVRKTRLSIESVDIYKMGQQISHLFKKDARQHGLELLYFFAPDCPRLIDTDHKRLQETLRNLLDNAIKFTNSGYVALTIDTVSHADVALIKNTSLMNIDTINQNNALSKDNANSDSTVHDWIRFSIEDSGIGIDIAKQHQLVTYLSQNNSTNKIKNNQYHQKNAMYKGLGLNDVNSFARLLGGFIQIKSSMGKGSTFSLYLPCRQPNYQPVYHLNPHLAHIHLIAIINQPLAAEHLKQLCNHLSIAVTVITSADNVDLVQLTDGLVKNKQNLAPILLLDYDYYESLTLVLSKPLDVVNQDSNNMTIPKQQITVTDSASINNGIINEKAGDKQQALNHLLSNVSLPKILLSMQSERRIASMLLDKCDGFLTKPLDANLLLSELLRLTLPTRKTFKQSTEISTNSDLIEITDKTNEAISPLILVVEDSPTNQKIACKILAKLGYRTIVAEDGQQALDILQTQRQEIALILMDCRMPVMDGLQATQAIRAQGDDIPIVALTANNTEEDRTACLEVGMDEFLAKPINKNKLQEMLASFIKT